MTNETTASTSTENTLKTVLPVEDVEPHEVAPGILRRKLPATAYARGPRTETGARMLGISMMNA
ncbi:hypothetical protein [Streptomyces cyaneofuscatus]|uniref:hypothetical protein n=1 Tax=Streptomyces cyaneofuscatus TaxID=66883 RepID=UPI0033AD312B